MPWLFQLFNANELAGRSLLPTLGDLFIAPCFRNSETAGYTEDTVKRITGAQNNVQSCLTDSVLYYGNLLMGVAALVCFIYIVRAGYIMFTAFGDEAKYAQGKKTLLYAVIGLAIAVAAGFIIGFFVNVLGYSGPDPFKPIP